MAVYVLARTADDIGDRAPVAERSGLLAELEADVRRLYGPSLPNLSAVRGLREAVAECGIPMQPVLDLIEANRQEQGVNRYQIADHLFCFFPPSSNPVVRIVLYAFNKYSSERA